MPVSLVQQQWDPLYALASYVSFIFFATDSALLYKQPNWICVCVLALLKNADI